MRLLGTMLRCSPLLLLATPSVHIRPAVLSDPADAEALCRVRKPTEYVVEQGAVGFMGQRTELPPEEAQRRRVQARLGSAIRDQATVLVAVEPEDSEDPVEVLGTVDCIELPAGKGRRALAPELPRRLLIRNLWVSEARRRQGVARQLMAAVEALAADEGITYLCLDVNADNEPALALYAQMGFEDTEPMPMPRWLRGALSLGKPLG
jgi:ribosomal protein S18 acetylase RimI-like enzyme